MKIIHYELKLVGVDKGKTVWIKENKDLLSDPLQLNHFNIHQLILQKGTIKIKEEDYEIRGLRKGCSISFDIGDIEREYIFTINEEFIKEFEQFLAQYIEKQIAKIESDFK